jgi:hypothetical protein
VHRWDDERRANRKVDAVTESIADGLSVLGLVTGFPLLLLGFMVSLERLESWGLRESEPAPSDAPQVRDTVESAVAETERTVPTSTPSDESASVGGRATR